MSFQQTNFALPNFRVKNNTELFQLETLTAIKDVRAPAVTTAERNALPATAGHLVFNTSTGKFQGFDGESWVDLN